MPVTVRGARWLEDAFSSLADARLDMKVIDGSSTDPEIVINGETVLLMCSPNYLGLANHPVVKTAAKDAIDVYGSGSVGSGFVSGYQLPHKQVEQFLADYMHAESAVFFNSVSSASMSLISAFIDVPLRPLIPKLRSHNISDCVVYMDQENHASLFDAVRHSRPTKTSVFNHNDIDHLEDQLKKHAYKRKIIVVDGYFSMSATLANIPELVRLANEHDATLIVDDAHGFGIFGQNGQGTVEHFGLNKQIDFVVGSTAKAIGQRGGFISGSRLIMKYIRSSSRRYMFSGTLPASVPASVIAALTVAQSEPWRRDRVLSNGIYLRNGLKAHGFTVLGEGPIVPWLIGDEDKADAVSHELLSKGIFAPSIRSPAVPRGKALVRFMVMATHNQTQLDHVINACASSTAYSSVKASAEIDPEIIQLHFGSNSKRQC